MASSEERREVAERLRNRGNDLYSLFYTRLARRVFGDDAWGNKSENEIFDKLADLIDPITTVELRAPWTICMKCGARMEGYQHKPVRFCPHFGRRIVR